jgi:hypothetical protein
MSPSGAEHEDKDTDVNVDADADADAVKTVNVATDEEVGEVIKGDHEPAPPKYKRSTKIFCFSVCVLLIAAAIVVAVLLTYDGKETSKDRDEAIVAPTTPTTTVPGAPTTPQGAPTLAPAGSQPIFVQPTPSASEPSGSVAPVAPLTTSSPTSTPTADLGSQIVDLFLQNGVVVAETDTASTLAVDFLAEELAGGFLDMSDAEKLIQRFAVLTLDLAMQGDQSDPSFGEGDLSANGTMVDDTTAKVDTSIGMGGGFVGQFEGVRNLQESISLGRPNLDECSWAGVTCVNGTVQELRLGSMGFSGTIPSEIGLLAGLTHLDLSQNQLHGSIPEQLYSLTDLVRLFLYKNQLTGTISASAGDWWSMTHLHLSHNQLTGSIPTTLASGDVARLFRKYRLRWIGSAPMCRFFPHHLLTPYDFAIVPYRICQPQE